MRLYTVQMSNWRQAAVFGIEVLDITVKSGDPVFAPTWDIVRGVKSGHITPAEYTRVYTQLMRDSYKANCGRWNEVLTKEAVALMCYCPDGAFCHRHVLADIFGKCASHYGLEFVNRGEIRNKR